MTDQDRMDQRLREYADRWRNAAAPSPVVDTERLGGGRRVPPWSLVLGSAAAIALMIFGATQLVGSDAPAGPASPVSTPTHAVEPTPLTRDGALRRALEADPAVRWEMLLAAPEGQFLCSLRVLGSSPSGDTFYLWLSCSDFVVAGNHATNRSGSSEPAVVHVRRSGTDIHIDKVTFPRQQSLDADIKRLFPPSIAKHIYDEDSTRTSPSEKELGAEAVRNAAS